MYRTCRIPRLELAAYGTPWYQGFFLLILFLESYQTRQVLRPVSWIKKQFLRFRQCLFNVLSHYSYLISSTVKLKTVYAIVQFQGFTGLKTPITLLYKGCHFLTRGGNDSSVQIPNEQFGFGSVGRGNNHRLSQGNVVVAFYHKLTIVLCKIRK